jgi:hypothetical protein
MGKSVWKIEEKRGNVAWSLAEKPRPDHLTVDLTFAIAWCFLPLLKHNMCRLQAQRRVYFILSML